MAVSCPHSKRGDPKTCSQCKGVTPQQVTQQGAAILVDGVVKRDIDKPPPPPDGTLPKKQRRGWKGKK